MYCDECGGDVRRLYMLNYMDKYRKRVRKLLYE